MTSAQRVSTLCLLTTLSLLGLTLLPIASEAAPQDTTRAMAPSARLGIILVVDQMVPDYLSRFSGQYTGGLARLLKQGLLFPNAYHDHAATETSVGHAALSTGRYPTHNGVIGNDWYDREDRRVVYSCEDSAARVLGDTQAVGRSPKRLIGLALGDWMKKLRPATRVYSVALKDRAAIMLGGKHPDAAFWYNRSTGHFLTSEYYMTSVPSWLDSFNTAGGVTRNYRTGWTLLLPDSAYHFSHADNFPSENDGIHTTFPHLFDTTAGVPDKTYFGAFYGTPFADGLLLDLARTVIGHAELGRDSIPDLLCISCSAADAIGHAYGPNSWEIQDYYLRLDKYLDTFLTYLDTTIGAGKYCIAMSSDHGILPLPEDLQQQGIASRRLPIDSIVRDIRAIGAQVQTDFKLEANPIADCGYDVQLTYDGARKNGMSDPDLQQLVAARLRRLSYISDVFTRDELQSGGGTGRPYFEQFRNSFHPLRGPDLYLRFPEFALPGSSKFGTSHGTPYSYDTNVPILFLTHAASGQSPDRVMTIDLAPTLARLLGVQIGPKDMDGQVLQQVFPTAR
jgi:predicted AlkP superfamily pyrophosphatase or phosphodiesterase